MHKKVGKSEKVQKFIEDLAIVDSSKYDIVAELYSLFSTASRDFTDKFIYGGIGIYIEDTLLGGIWVYKSHVSLVFGEGYRLSDSYKVLEGAGKFRRHIKVHEFKDIEQKKCAKYIKQLFDLYK